MFEYRRVASATSTNIGRGLVVPHQSFPPNPTDTEGVCKNKWLTRCFFSTIPAKRNDTVITINPDLKTLFTVLLWGKILCIFLRMLWCSLPGRNFWTSFSHTAAGHHLQNIGVQRKFSLWQVFDSMWGFTQSASATWRCSKRNHVVMVGMIQEVGWKVHRRVSFGTQILVPFDT